ncbi:MAG: alginate export family protein [Planctomycetota bacterium]
MSSIRALPSLGILLLCVGISLAAASEAAYAAPQDGLVPLPPPRETPQPPKYGTLSFEEDWSPFVCVPTCDRPDWTDRIKAIRLDRSGSTWVSFGGQVRFRLEGWENFAFGAVPDESWLLTRVRAYGDLHVGRFRFYVEGIFADQATRTAGPRPIDENHGDFLNLFGEFETDLGQCHQTGLRVGRQELLFGKQRLISPLDWANTRRTFDGARAWVRNAKKWRLDAFWTRPVTVDKVEIDEWNEDVQFAGLYYTNKCNTCLEWDAYFLYLQRDRATYLGVTGEEDRFTVGLRGNGPIGGSRFDWDAEAAYQFGEFGAQTISAAMATVELGYEPWQCWKPRFSLGFDWATGDSDGPGGDLGTFNQLFPLGHAYLGYADFIGRQNNMAARVRAEVKPTDAFTAQLTYFEFWRAETTDAVYNAGGGVLRAPMGNTESHVMGELDLLLKYQIDRHWQLLGGWSHVIPGAFIEQTGPGRDVDFFYAQLQVTF